MARTKKETTEAAQPVVQEDPDPIGKALRFSVDATEPVITEIKDDDGNVIEIVKTPTRVFAGVPCRDLTADEVSALPQHLRRGLLASGIYSE